MAHGGGECCGHGHHHHHGGASRNILTALALNASFAVIELIGGLLTQSVAIMADAVHDLGDSLALGLAWYFERAADRKSDKHFSYGYRRLSLLSAVLTAAFLVVASVFMIAQAIPRLMNPIQPNTTGMLGLAVLGIAVNGYAAWRMQHGSTMNERVLSWHLIEDVLGWVAVLVVSVVMRFVDLPILDPILCLVFTSFIIFGVLKSFRQTVHLFLQGTPAGLDVGKMSDEIRAIPEVCDIHDVHVWSLDGESHVLTLHAVVPPTTDLAGAARVIDKIRGIVATHGNIHVTVEIEPTGANCPNRHCAHEAGRGQ